MLCGLVLAAYSNSFHGALTFDSNAVIAQDPRIRQFTWANTASILNGGYWYGNPDGGLYRPLTTFSYLLNYTLFGNGAAPAAYHLVNLALHEMNVVLVYVLGVLILEEVMPALALAAIWGLHPLLTESVTNIVGRADLLATLGVLTGMLCYTKSVNGPRCRLTWLAALFAAQTVAIFAKESGAVLIGLMLLFDVTRPDRTKWRPRILSYAVVLLPLAAFFFLRSGLGLHMRIEVSENPLVGTDFWTARLTAIKVIGRYLWLFLWPSQLSADYSWNATPLFGWRLANLDDAKTLIAAVALCVAGIAATFPVVRMRAGRALLFFFGFFFVALLPASNLIVLIGSIMAERFLYLPSVGLAGVLVAAVYALSRVRSALVVWVALALVCVTFAVRTYARNSDWQDGLSLWTSAAAVSPESAKVHYNLARELERLPGRLPEAIAEYREAVRIEPYRADAHDNLANALSGMPDRLPEAIAEYGKALRIDHGLAAVHNDLANALVRLPGRTDEAIAEYRAALRIQPQNAEIHYNLANALSGMPDMLETAIGEYRAALAIQPDHADAHNNLGNALAGTSEQLPAAIHEYEEALRVEPEMVAAHINLGNALARIPGRLPDAIAQYRAALRLQPDSPEAHSSLGNALANMPGHLPEAIAEFESALRIEPNFADAHVSLGKALELTPGRTVDAVAEYEAALRIRPDPRLRQAVDRLRAGLR